MQQVSDLPVSEYLNRWLRESVMNLPPETYGRYAYDPGRVVVPYFEKKRLSLKALSLRAIWKRSSAMSVSKRRPVYSSFLIGTRS